VRIEKYVQKIYQFLKDQYVDIVKHAREIKQLLQNLYVGIAR
jgi:hypothetical protein